jgi:hypothetical protein
MESYRKCMGDLGANTVQADFKWEQSPGKVSNGNTHQAKF